MTLVPFSELSGDPSSENMPRFFWGNRSLWPLFLKSCSRGGLAAVHAALWVRSRVDCHSNPGLLPLKKGLEELELLELNSNVRLEDIYIRI